MGLKRPKATTSTIINHVKFINSDSGGDLNVSLFGEYYTVWNGETQEKDLEYPYPLHEAFLDDWLYPISIGSGKANTTISVFVEGSTFCIEVKP